MGQLVFAPISIGDLWDKITILNIKLEEYGKVDNETNRIKIEYVNKELAELMKIINDLEQPSEPVDGIVKNLKAVNHMIWRHEDVVRTYGSDLKPYDSEFIKLVTDVHQGNKDRCQYKLDINKLYNSDIVETKSYINEGLK
jgi:hypothetical protein